MLRLASLLLACLTVLTAGVSPEEQAVLDRITAGSLRGDVWFLASDLLEGRGTPSRGLDIAAEYIAAQFARAGLEPAGDDGYFQTSQWMAAGPNPDGFSLTIELNGERWVIPVSQVALPLSEALSLERAGVYLVPIDDQTALDALTAGEVAGKAALVRLEGPSREALRAIGQLRRLNPACILLVDASGSGRPATVRLRESGAPLRINGPPSLTIHSEDLFSALSQLAAGPIPATVSLHLSAPVDRQVQLRNVVGLLRGSDPALQDTYVMLDAHYDHVGIGDPVDGDSIYNGANDDASGAAAVIEVASALAAGPARPKRSILFAAFFGEERGLLGSRYYARHPVVPLGKTVAAVSLEQVGRTDSTDGPRIDSANLTGFTYSDVPAIFAEAGAQVGVRISGGDNGDSYFARSDNVSLAEVGVPSHTLAVTYEFPGYHQPDDEWDKINYPNMEKVTRAVALGMLMLADRAEPPHWNAGNPKTERYREAQAAR